MLVRTMTQKDFDTIKRLANQGVGKTAAAKAIDAGTSWMDRAAHRDGFGEEYKRLWDCNSRSLDLNDEVMARLKELAQAGFTVRRAAKAIGTTSETLRRSAINLGLDEQLTAIFPAQRPRTKRLEVLPRDVDPVVQALTKPWRKAA